MADGMEVTTRFESWLRRAGASWDEGLMRINRSTDELGRTSFGVFAKRDIPEGTSLCVIPKSSVLSIRTTGIADLLEEAQILGGLGLTLAVMYERALGEASPW